ncbi:MAG: hypothetical protein KK478_21245 [Ensifer alkalisoli]|nr:hypothetical protein [Sinorhizobium alkalisoli]
MHVIIIVLAQTRIASAMLITAITLVGCVSSGIPIASGQLAVHPYRTDPSCRRVEPLWKFDARCDHPVVGIRNFYAPFPF